MGVLRFYKIADWKTHWTYGFLKDLNRFFFQKPRKSKNAPYYPLMHSPESFSNIKSKFHNFLGEDGSKYIAKNYFCTQNVVRNAYMNEFTISLRN